MVNFLNFIHLKCDSFRRTTQVFHENYQRNLKQWYENFGRIFNQFLRYSIFRKIKKTVYIFLDN